MNLQPTCYRALNRHQRGWGWVIWLYSDVATRLRMVYDMETGETYPAAPGSLRTDWYSLPADARARLKTMPPAVRQSRTVHALAREATA